MSRNQIVRTQLSHRPSDSVNAKGHPTFTPGAPHLYPGAPHLHPWATPPSSLGHPTFIPGASHLRLRCLHPPVVQAVRSRVRRISPCLAPTHPVQRMPPWAHLLIPSCLHSPGPARSSATACRHCLLQDHRHVLQPPSGTPPPCTQPASASRPPSQLPSPCLPDPGLPLHSLLSAAPWVWPRPASRQVSHCPSCAPRLHPCLILIPLIARSWHLILRFLVPLPLLNISIIFQINQLT